MILTNSYHQRSIRTLDVLIQSYVSVHGGTVNNNTLMDIDIDIYYMYGCMHIQTIQPIEKSMNDIKI